MPLERPAVVQGQADVQPGLAAQGRQHGVGLLDGEDLLDELGGDRLDVGAVGHLGVGHDRGRVGVDQHDLVALLAEGLARLGPRVVELAGLADHDRAGADDQDLVDVSTLGHGGSISSRRRSVSGRSGGARGGRIRTWIGPRSPRFVRRRRGPENFPILATGRGAPRQGQLARPVSVVSLAVSPRSDRRRTGRPAPRAARRWITRPAGPGAARERARPREAQARPGVSPGESAPGGRFSALTPDRRGPLGFDPNERRLAAPGGRFWRPQVGRCRKPQLAASPLGGSSRSGFPILAVGRPNRSPRLGPVRYGETD